MFKIILSKLIKIVILIIVIQSMIIGCSKLKKENEKILNKNTDTNIIFGVIESINPLIISGNEFKIDKKKNYTKKINLIKKLNRGQNVIASYVLNKGSLEITSIKQDNILIAPVSFIGDAELIVLNQKIIISDMKSEELKKIIPGHWVKVSGFYQKEGEILSTHIQLIASQSIGYIKGKVSEIDKNTISIGRQNFKIRAPVSSTVSGDIVKIVFTKEDDLYKTFEIENLSNKYINLINHNIIIEGFIFKGDDKKFRVSGFPFIIYNSSALSIRDRLIIKGKILAGSIIDNK